MDAKAQIGHLVAGHGKQKVIALHDWMGNHQNWRWMIPYIDQTTYTYAFMDVRGYGLSKGIAGRFHPDEIVLDIFNLADDLGWNQFHLIGHSMTGMVVQKAILLDEHNRIGGLIAISPVAASGFPIDDETATSFKNIPTDPTVAAMAYNAFTCGRLSQTWTSQRVGDLHQNTDRHAMLAYLQMWSETDFSAQVAGHQKDLMVTYGDQDHHGFQREAILNGFDHYGNIHFFEINNVGHYPMQESPPSTAAVIENYLLQHAF